MKKPNRYLPALLAVLAVVTVSFRVLAAGDAQSLFEQKCLSCHTIGAGRTVGPDLEGVTANRDTAWLINFITAPDKVIAGGDPIAKELVQQYGLPMPNLGVTEEEARAVLVYIDTQSSVSKAATTQAAIVTSPAAAAAASATDASDGESLFTGRAALQNGGPSCLSCHNLRHIGGIGGGTVGKDLTGAYAALGEAGINSILKTTPFPMMKEIYTAKPLTAGEIGAISAFLKEANREPSGPPQNPLLFFVIGGVSAVGIIGLFQWLWRERLSSVRRQLVKGGRK